MLELTYPWMLALLLLPILARLLPVYRERRQAVAAPFFGRLAILTGQDPARGAVVQRRGWGRTAVTWFAWALVVLALTRPTWVEDPIVRTDSARDLLIAVDLSGSMTAEDFTDADGRPVDRLTALKGVLTEFIERREGDRIGLVAFGSSAFLQVPFTSDRDTLLMLLDTLQIAMPGPRTMIGDAIGLGVRHFASSDVEERVYILMTDGVDTGSQVAPVRAARIAAEAEVTIHTIAIGDPETATDDDPLDLETLNEIAEITGGGSFLAKNRGELEQVYAELDALEPQILDERSYRPRRPLYHWPLGGFLLLALVFQGGLAVSTRRLGEGG